MKDYRGREPNLKFVKVNLEYLEAFVPGSVARAMPLDRWSSKLSHLL